MKNHNFKKQPDYKAAKQNELRNDKGETLEEELNRYSFEDAKFEHGW